MSAKGITTYWRKRWREGRIGFHQSEFDRHLVRFGPEVLGLRGSAVDEIGKVNTPRILVPLCGKSLDLLWLRDHGAKVTGVELAPEACTAFLSENKLPENPVDGIEGFRRFTSPGLELLEGDLFNLPAKRFDGIWDRAALIAIPPDHRRRYAKHLTKRLGCGKSILLVTIEYDRTRMEGPPFSIPEQEIENLYPDAEIEKLNEAELPESAEKFSIPWMIERVHRVQAREKAR